MSKIQHPDIDDNQIRIISAESPENTFRTMVRKSRRGWLIVLGLVAVALIAVIVCLYWPTEPDTEAEKLVMTVEAPVPADTAKVDTIAAPMVRARVEVLDTIINEARFTILKPLDAKPALAVGKETLNDTTAILVVQAADVRRDNGKIVGAFVAKGQLLSSGQSKAGFCAIIGDKITIGVADATPYLEQAIDYEGDFFRQYPLVVGGQVVENKPKGRSYRKALAELNGSIVVIIGRDRMTFHDFSQALVDMGVTNAIYLVGSKSYCFAKTDSGDIVSFGNKADYPPTNVSYLVWHR